MITDQFQNELLALLLTTETCGVCVPIDKQLSKEIEINFPKLKYKKINLDNNPEIRGQLMVFSAPTFILIYQGKEYIRTSGVFSVLELIEKIERIYNFIYPERLD